MDNIIFIDNISFKYGERQIYKDFSLKVDKGDFLSIIGPNGSGKSTLIRILLGLYVATGKITVCGLEMNGKNVREIMKKVGVVLENPDDQFVAETVMHDIAFSLENLRVPAKEIRSKVFEVAKYLGIEDILDKEPHSISGGQKQLVALACALVTDPEILILDEAFSMIDIDTRDKIYDILKDLNENKNITIINVTHDEEDLLHGNKILILNDGEIVKYGFNKEVLSDEKAFTKYNLKLPFMVDLSTKLKYYGLVDDIILDMDEMVDLLWK